MESAMARHLVLCEIKCYFPRNLQTLKFYSEKLDTLAFSQCTFARLSFIQCHLRIIISRQAKTHFNPMIIISYDEQNTFGDNNNNNLVIIFLLHLRCTLSNELIKMETISKKLQIFALLKSASRNFLS